MRFAALGYFDESQWETLSEQEHPGVKAGGFEIRPVVDMTEQVEASRSRRVGGGS